MNFIIVGGGCYGSFYTRQLLRGLDRIPLEKLHIIDRDSGCQVARDYPEEHPHREKLVFHVSDWKEALKPLLRDRVKRRQRGEESDDHYVPPCFAPHILFEVFQEMACEEFPRLSFRTLPFAGRIGTPFEALLPSGQTALSFATWKCPHSCIEPPTCPKTRGPKDWDMFERLKDHFETSGVSEEHQFLFRCLHFAMGVGTIPCQVIVDDYLRFRKLVAKAENLRIAVGTISSCHGLAALMEVSHG